MLCTKTTSFPGSLIFRSPGGDGKMRDPGNKVGIKIHLVRSMAIQSNAPIRYCSNFFQLNNPGACFSKLLVIIGPVRQFCFSF